MAWIRTPGHPDGPMRTLFNSVVHDPGNALNITSGLVGASGSITKGNAEASSFKSQAAADDYNAIIATRNAAAAGKEGTAKEILTRQDRALALGNARAAAGEAGIGGPQGGTIQTALEQDSINAELDALTVRYETDTKRNAFIDESQMDTYNAGVARSNAKVAKRAGYIGAVGNILQSANRYYAQKTAIDNASPPAGGSASPKSVPLANTDGYFSFNTPANNLYVDAYKNNNKGTF